MKLYVVRNKEGKFFKNIGYGGTGVNWQDSLEKAKFYAKIGQAKARVTYFFSNYPQYGCPDILEFELDVKSATIIDGSENAVKGLETKIKKVQKRKDNLNKNGYNDNSDYYSNEIRDLKNKLEKIKENLK